MFVFAGDFCGNTRSFILDNWIKLVLMVMEFALNTLAELVVEEEKLRGGVRFIEKIPRNELGKIMRQNLKKLL